jgi:hypothetical protein
MDDYSRALTEAGLYPIPLAKEYRGTITNYTTRSTRPINSIQSGQAGGITYGNCVPREKMKHGVFQAFWQRSFIRLSKPQKAWFRLRNKVLAEAHSATASSSPGPIRAQRKPMSHIGS